MRRRILKRWLYHYGFRFTAGVASLLIDDAREGDLAARLFIRQAEARHATEMFRDKILMPLLALKNRAPELIFTAELPQNPNAMP